MPIPRKDHCPGCDAPRGALHYPGCAYSTGPTTERQAPQAPARADSDEIADTAAAALKLIDQLYVRLGARLPSEMWRAKVSLETVVIYHSTDPVGAGG